ncbi:gluconate 2-dehydrogenase subunit 3 family protein [Psychrosphaera sp. 1_MG-2023]|uniref:Gluconate 2-dehydrogenase subunit 3 family protein n=1 Tax=Psychrosphaera algicola TaxID=3023714 RepID=A0ABT5FDS9_9GAMM|nr:MULTISPECIES: gluconate 2-dehydrogenase subunit 3 family protein [unclassified Psychrosphaera]MDC2889710.1 gluconate 2-dehydrogenase subunit 3 family protein [Psychrosphaera sp. G1-22]MDO6719042.1 gluconate 2-dehydrogenase subunit 3 family protein [Psychrosphaera sp. 1_MG-2023]
MEPSNNELTEPTRRDFLRKLGLVVGSSAAFTLVSGVKLNQAFAYEMTPNSAHRKGKTFTQSQMATLAKIARTVLPKTDTPSAEDVDCHGFIDHQLAVCYNEHDRRLAIEIVDDIESAAINAFSTSFAQLIDSQRHELLTKLERLDGFNHDQKSKFQLIKHLIVFGFFTSEVGATQALRYLPVPGGFTGSIPYKKGDKAWGSHAFY